MNFSRESTTQPDAANEVRRAYRSFVCIVILEKLFKYYEFKDIKLRKIIFALYLILLAKLV